jgi:hypothetical protein
MALYRFVKMEKSNAYNRTLTLRSMVVMDSQAKLTSDVIKSHKARCATKAHTGVA